MSEDEVVEVIRGWRTGEEQSEQQVCAAWERGRGCHCCWQMPDETLERSQSRALLGSAREQDKRQRHKMNQGKFQLDIRKNISPQGQLNSGARPREGGAISKFGKPQPSVGPAPEQLA